MPHRSRNKILKKSAVAIAIIAAAFPLALLLALLIKATSLPPLSLTDARETSVIVTDREGRLLRPYATEDGRWRLPVDLETLDEDYVKMLLAYEDQRFFEHGGIDIQSLMRAAWQIVTNGKIISGGSTITMQLARLVDGLETRSMDAKLTQLIRAIELEHRFSKKEILSLYLTLAPYGGNIEGVRAASLAYFGKEPKRLNNAERALLVALPQSPEARRPDRHSKTAADARARVLDRLESKGLISKADSNYAKSRPLPKDRRPFPLYAAHLADIETAREPGTRVHKLTLDRTIQDRLEKLTHNYVQKQGDKLSAAILVSDHQSGEVLAYVGSAGYLDKKRLGGINMVEATRSPGSTLKPFIYGLTFEAGLAHPETLIEDRPTQFDDYTPKNFDLTYKGTVTVREALQSSLNIPAVKALAAIGPARLSNRLEQTDKRLKIPRNLSIALGGTGVTLKSLNTLYAALANEGKPISLVTRESDKKNALAKQNATPLLSPLAAWYVSDILAGTPPPKNAKGGKIAFKTGTSYGYRDTWAVGFDGQHIVSVWIGRPDATPTQNLTGIRAAAPLLFDVFARIASKRVSLPPPPASALQMKTAELPNRLIHFETASNQSGQVLGKPETAVKISFPPNKVELDLEEGHQDGATPIILKAQGGNLPLTWLADGAPIKSRAGRRTTFWQPSGTGFHKITVIDAAGKVDRISIRIR